MLKKKVGAVDVVFLGFCAVLQSALLCVGCLFQKGEENIFQDFFRLLVKEKNLKAIRMEEKLLQNKSSCIL